MNINLLNTYESEANKIAHSGYLTRAPAIRGSDVIATELVKQAAERKIKIQYDITYENHPHELTFTECFGGAGGIYVRPADSDFSRELLSSNSASFLSGVLKSLLWFLSGFIIDNYFYFID